MLGLCVGAGLALAGCGYYHYAGPLQPSAEQQARVALARDNTVRFRQGELTIEVRPLTEAELNRQFAASEPAGGTPVNPYTFGDTEFWKGEQTRQRFTTFRLHVVNNGFPKVKIDPARIALRSGDVEYWSLSQQQLDTYYRAYTIGFRGNEYARYQERLDILTRTMFKNEEVFLGQEVEGYVVFPVLDHDIRDVELVIHDAVLRFDYRNEPVETVQITCRFERDVGRIYRDGRLEIEAG